MGRIITYHVTGRLSQILLENVIHPRVLTPEHNKENLSPEEAFSNYLGLLNKSNSERPSSPEYQKVVRLTHTHFSDDLFYLIWKIHKRKIQNSRRGLPEEEVATLKISIDESELGIEKSKHLLVLGSVKDVDKRLIGIGKGYLGLLRMMSYKNTGNDFLERYSPNPNHLRIEQLANLS